jgi:hypothetical protein
MMVMEVVTVRHAQRVYSIPIKQGVFFTKVRVITCKVLASEGIYLLDGFRTIQRTTVNELMRYRMP